MYTPTPTTLEASPTQKRFTGYGKGYLVFDGQTIREAVFITSNGVAETIHMPPDLALGTPDDFALIASKAAGAEILLLGTGDKALYFPPQRLLPLFQQGFGLEIMATVFACHAYNLLADEGRKTAALLLPPASDSVIRKL
ncbi:MAG: Mth938-like domain-containing protein [Betaproteobacteria bacterium]|nr:Mth938-like domain-containing protein [Betaproteobacteria bacterium]